MKLNVNDFQNWQEGWEDYLDQNTCLKKVKKMKKEEQKLKEKVKKFVPNREKSKFYSENE